MSLVSQIVLGLQRLASEIKAVRAAASLLGGHVVGQYCDNALWATGTTTLIGVANQIDLAPFKVDADLSIDQIGVNVTTAVASSQVKISIYESAANGWPGALVYQSAAINTTAAGFAFVALTFTFSKSKTYWLGVHHSLTSTLSRLPLTSAVSLGLLASNATTYATVLRRSITFATGAPATWAFVNADRVANVAPPNVRFRVSAVA